MLNKINVLSRPYGTGFIFIPYPVLKRRSKVKRPYGTEMEPLRGVLQLPQEFIASRMGRSCMHYEIEFKPRAIKDLKGFPNSGRKRLVAKIEALQNDLKGDVKKTDQFSARVPTTCGRFSRFI
jgi:hypothetical protein